MFTRPRTQLGTLAGLAILFSAGTAFGQDGEATISAGDTAWIMTSTALVLLMTLPGLALFYGGLVRQHFVVVHGRGWDLQAPRRGLGPATQSPPEASHVILEVHY